MGEPEITVPMQNYIQNTTLTPKNTFATQADRRAHHNALERKRRDHIKDSFTSLRDTIPSLHGDKVSPYKIPNFNNQKVEI